VYEYKSQMLSFTIFLSEEVMQWSNQRSALSKESRVVEAVEKEAGPKKRVRWKGGGRKHCSFQQSSDGGVQHAGQPG